MLRISSFSSFLIIRIGVSEILIGNGFCSFGIELNRIVIFIDVLDNIVFNLIKISEGQKISSKDVLDYLQSFKIKVNNEVIEQDPSFTMSEIIFDETLKVAREEFEKLYFNFHMHKKISVTELAKISGVERTHLYRKLKSLGIKNK